MSPSRRKTATLAAWIASTFVVFFPRASHAYDSSPCGGQTQVTVSGLTRVVQYCPIWRGNVPVHREASPWSPVVGYLYVGGWANWFSYQCQQPDQPYFYGSNYWNSWYAYTLSDNGTWGFVNEVYFSGGNNDEPDRGLIRSTQAFGNPDLWRCSDLGTQLAH